ncbi:MAG: glucosidase [Planctomycetes bacterium]|nr:glucosidase [Planctomycetota bacterium]
MQDTREGRRLAAASSGREPWRRWGPYLSERQWGTVREDYSANGDAWSYFTHEQARSRAYRWGEDGLGGISDDRQRLCFALALWNGRDPILKERLFGLANAEGNHGEDVKEYYYYLDSTPTHSWMRYLYKYPQAEFPYRALVAGNQARDRKAMEYELMDTGAFDGDRYFDVLVEYAKAAPEEMLVRISITNRGPETASVHVLPTLWFRNTWSWSGGTAKPGLRRGSGPRGVVVVEASHPELGTRWMVCEGDVPLLFTENETDHARLFGGRNAGPYVKDAFHEHVVRGVAEAVNPGATGTKAAAHHRLEIAAGQTAVLRLRIGDSAPAKAPFGGGFDAVLRERSAEADEFYRAITPASTDADRAMVLRQALAGMLWSKQYYWFDLDLWLREHAADPLVAKGPTVRNHHWFHMVNADVISMPDKWEYPWYAAWDLAFHTIPLGMVDPEFAKGQLELMLNERYLHPSGQIPAYEWNFGDVNPPVHAWAALFLYRSELERNGGRGDVAFLQRVFQKLTMNFTWWVNRKDRLGRNVFEGGFLGLDNVSVFDRSAPLPTGGFLEQADGTAWMAFFCQCMLEMAVELVEVDPGFEDLAIKFADHFLWIAAGIHRAGVEGLWDEADGFYYDLLRLPDGRSEHLKVRSIVGLLPLCASTVLEPWQAERVPRLVAHVQQRLQRMPELQKSMHPLGTAHRGHGGRALSALVNEERLRRILARMLDENEFLSPFGIRALSRCHREQPFVVNVHGQEHRVDYWPAESESGLFGGNSNWRGPVWFPVNALLIRGLLNLYLYHGDGFRVECPSGSGRTMNLFEVASELSNRLTRIFLKDERGRRPVFGGVERFQTDPHWRDHLLFYEYFHGDNGAGVGASHQTGWTGLVAKLIELQGTLDARRSLERGKPEPVAPPA